METFDIGRTFARAWRVALGTLASAGVLLLVVQVASLGLQFVMSSSMGTELAAIQANPDPTARLAIFQSGAYWALLFIGLVLWAFSSAAAQFAMLRTADGAAVDLGRCLRAGAAKMIPLLVLIFLWGLGVGLGMALLIIPGLILMTMWSCAMQTLVSEGSGVIASFSRSRALTKGSRIKIFVVLLAYLIAAYAILFGIVGAVIGFNMTGIAAMANASPVFLVASAMFGWINAVALNALLASIFIECRNSKEGGSTEQKTEVFA
jgi:hypothetical protein